MAVSRRTGLPAARLEARSDVTISPEDEQALATRFGIRSNLDRDMHQFLVLAEKPPDGLGGDHGVLGDETDNYRELLSADAPDMQVDDLWCHRPARLFGDCPTNFCHHRMV